MLRKDRGSAAQVSTRRNDTACVFPFGNSIGMAPFENFAKTVTSSITATGSTKDLNVRDKDEERTADRFLEERARERMRRTSGGALESIKILQMAQ